MFDGDLLTFEQSRQYQTPTTRCNMSLNVKTQVLILSDTHGKDFAVDGLPTCDVVIHCGDLTDGSKLQEFRTTLHNLNLIEAPLKLVIAGNHDFTMDLPAFERKVADASQPLDPELVAREYGIPGQAKKLFDDGKDAGIIFLDEGTHHFTLANGAQLSVYASPYTPSMGQWGFQYHPNKGHDFKISKGIDVAITHGPPRGIMDYTYGKERAGCSDLFTAISNARPRVHCFGHIHEGWGARLVTWKDGIEQPTHFTAIDNDRSPVIEKLAGLRAGKFDSEEDIAVKKAKLERSEKERCFKTDCGTDGDHEVEHGKQTLFVNASIEGAEEFEQRPWLIGIDLPKADSKEGETISADAHQKSPRKRAGSIEPDEQRIKRSRRTPNYSNEDAF